MVKPLHDEILKVVPHLSDEQIAEMIIKGENWREVIDQYAEPDSDLYSDDPVEFIHDVLEIALWKKQVEIVESVLVNRNTIISAGHSVGKSYMIAALVCYWLTKFPDSIVVTLAPVYNQVQNIIWRYIRYMGRNHDLPGEILDTPRWNISELNYAIGLSPKKTSQEDMTAMQGYHAPKLLVIMDEAPGMNRLMFEAVKNLATSSGNRIVAIGNPIAQSGPFWDACNSKSWNHIHISCLDHPNVVEKNEIVPGAVSYEWVVDMVNDHCTNCEPGTPGAIEWEGQWYLTDAVFQSRVLGIAPSESEMQLIPSAWIFTSQMMEIEPDGSERIIGFDPARSGDEAAMICREGGYIHWVKTRRAITKDITGEMAGWLMAEIYDTEITRAFVDEIGIGAGVVDACVAAGFPVLGINVSRPASQQRRFGNLRAEVYWRIREALKLERLVLPDDDLLAADLIAPKYSFDRLSRIMIEEKKDIRSRIGRSPDRGDALSLTFAMPDTLIEGDQDRSQFGMTVIDELGSKWAVIKSGLASAGSRWSAGGGGRSRFRGRK